SRNDRVAADPQSKTWKARATITAAPEKIPLTIDQPVAAASGPRSLTAPADGACGPDCERSRPAVKYRAAHTSDQPRFRRATAACCAVRANARWQDRAPRY